MNTYYCKCGMQMRSSASGATTALKDPERYYPNQLHAYGETSDLSCKGCPYICISRTYKGATPIDTPVARLSKQPPVLTTGLGKFSLTDNTVGKIYTLDWDLARRIKDAEKEIDGLLPDQYWDNLTYQASQYHEDGRFVLTINPEGGKKGIAAKQKLCEMFFNPDGCRKDLTPDEEKEKVLRGIVAARKIAQRKGEQQMSYRSEDVYKTLEGTKFRIHYDAKVKAYHTEYSAKNERCWHPRNSSWYPRFPDACNEFDAFVRSMNLIKAEDGCTNCQHFESLEKPYGNRVGYCYKKSEDDPINITDRVEEGGKCRSWMHVGETNKDKQEESECKEENCADTASSPAAEAPDDIPADAADATLTLPDAEPASLAQVFDYSGLSVEIVDTLHVAENLIKKARKNFLSDMATAVSIAHDALCTDATQCRNGEGKFIQGKESFGAWCESVGISRKTGERLLQVDALLSKLSADEQKILEAAPATLLYAASKPSAPQELVQQVKSGEITTNKQFQEALAAKKAAEAERDAAQARADKAEKESAGIREENARLVAENRELQKRPVTEVLPPDPAEVDRRVKEEVGLVWEQNKALKEIIEDREPTPDEKMAMFGQLQRFCRSIIDQWDLIKENLTVLPKELHDQFRKEFIKNLMIMEKEVDEY